MFTKGLLFVSNSVILSALAQLMMKVGMLELQAVFASEHFKGGFSIDQALLYLPALIWVVSGLFSYATSMLFWLAALARYELGLAYPLLSLSYILVYFGATIWPRLNETVSLTKTTGTLLIVTGVFLVARSAALQKPKKNGVKQ